MRVLETPGVAGVGADVYMNANAVTAAALRHPETGLVITLPSPARHAEIVHTFHQTWADPEYIAECEQGFLDRQEAEYVAGDANQILGQALTPGTLYSEDLW